MSVVILLGGGPQIAAGSIAIVPPTTCDDYETEGSTEESEDECRPLTAQELKNKIMKSVSLYKSMISSFMEQLLALLMKTVVKFTFFITPRSIVEKSNRGILLHILHALKKKKVSKRKKK